MAENGILDYQGMNQAIYRGATSNIVVDTQSMSIEIGAGNTSHTSNLHFECNHDANVASIKLNSNVVTEFSRSKKLIKYPRVALTSASDNAYENGYKVTVSNEEGGHKAYDAFDGAKGANSVELWYSGTLSHYSTSDGSAVTSGTNIAPRLDTNTDYGEWIGIELPVAIKLQSFHLWQQYNDHNHFPQSSTLYAKRESSDPWAEIYRYDNRTRSLEPDRPEIFDDVDSERFYKHFALVCRRRVQGTNATTGVSLGEWELYGVPEYDPDAAGLDVKVTSYPNVPNTDWLEVYYDAKGLTPGAVGSSIPGLGGTTINGTAYGGVTVSDGAFVLDGTNDYITTSALGFSGDQVHTISIWFRSDRPQTDMTTENGIYGFGHSNNLYAGLSWWSHVTVPGSSLRFWHDGSAGKNFPGVTFLGGMWNHLVLVYPGGGAFNSRVWLNGVELTGVNGTGSGGNNYDFNWSTGDTMIIGDWYSGSGPRLQSPWHGKIANFRLFNRSLTQDEVYHLYADQKEYFGHGDLSMTLTAGRLGIGTSEPSAALDVRGDIIGGCPVFFRVWKSTDTLQGANPIIWNQITVNKGSGYSTITGKFTAPVSGYYEFIYGGVSGRTDWSAEMHAHKNNGSRIAGASAYAAGGNGHWGRQLTNTIILELKVGETFHLSQPGGNQDMLGGSTYSYNFFSGKYLSN